MKRNEGAGRVEAKTIVLKFQVTPSEHKNIRIASALNEMKLSEFLRMVVLDWTKNGVDKFFQGQIQSGSKESVDRSSKKGAQTDEKG